MESKKLYESGCMICGEELVYTTLSNNNVKCSFCGKEENSSVACKHGHYVCDECHKKDTLDLVYNICIHSDEKDPVALANRIFEIPNLNMHGPEYHSIVPAIIVTTYQNIRGSKNSERIMESLNRGKTVKGGSCGINGACGAAVGVGIAYSILEDVTPMSKVLRGNANKMTALALLDIAEFNSARCCKREAITSLNTFVKNNPIYDEYQGKSEYKCIQYKDNKTCIGGQCPFFVNENR